MKDPVERTVEIPIIMREGKVEFYYGGPLPKLKDGQVGTIEMPAFAFENADDVARLSIEETVPILEIGTLLHVHVSPRDDGSKIDKAIVRLQASDGFWGKGGFVPIYLDEKLLLTFRGTKKPLLEPCRCTLPSLGKSVESINQAYTRLSEKFEPHRRTNTGNVFTKVFYLPPGKDVWLPLDTLREHHQEIFEKKMFQAHGWLFSQAEASGQKND